MGGAPRIHVVDDSRALRRTLAATLRADGYTVSAHAAAQGLLDSLDDDDCIVSDIRMPGMSGLELLTAVRERPIPVPVILISGHANVNMAVRAMKLGAADLIEKPFRSDRLLLAVRQATRRLQDGVADEAAARAATLSIREREVFEHLMRGATNKEIALFLRLSPRTVEVYRAQLMSKMRVLTYSGLIRVGLGLGLG